MRRLPLALVVVLCAGAAVAEDGVHVVRTEHYELHYAGDPADARETARVLEAAYAEYASFFEAEPDLAEDERLIVRVLSDRRAFNAAIRADGTQPPAQAGGYYWPGSKTAYLFRQPTRYYSRALLIHEAAHQFHYLARTRNENPGAGWYTEGIAEYLCWHMWDGRSLTLGVVPPLSLKDYPRQALEQMTAKDFDLASVVEGDAHAERPVGWAVVAWLATGRHGKPQRGFRTFLKKADKGTHPGKAFRQVFGKVSGLAPRIVSWLSSHQQPWEQVFNEWEMVSASRIRGSARVVSLCRPRGPCDRIAAKLEVPEAGAFQGGLLLHFVDGDDYTVALVDAAGGLRVNRRRAGRWERLGEGAVGAPPRGKTIAMSAERAGDGVRLRVSGKAFGPFDLPGTSLGLALDGATLHFRDVAVN